MEPIRLSSFPELSVEDTVSLEVTAHGEGSHVELVLEAAADVTWWKALELRSQTGALLATVETQDSNHGPNVVSIPVNQLPGARLTLAKAKVFGVHTGMYELRDLDSQSGRRMLFIWQRDDHRDGPVAGFFRDLGGGISQAANAVAEVVETVANAVAEVVSDVIETVGTFFHNVLESFANLVRGIPIIGPLAAGVLHWAATVVSAVFDFVASIFKAGIELWGNLIGGVIRVVGGAVGGLMAWDGRLLVKGVGDVVSGILGPWLVVVGKAVAAVQAILFMQLGERALSDAERDLLRQVFRNSVALYNVHVVEGFAGLFSTNGRPFVIGNTIYMKGIDPTTSPADLVHECTHVWQNQNVGARFTTDALWAQLTVPNTYSWQDELARGHLRWQDFNKEAQASFIEDVWRSGGVKPTKGMAGGPTGGGVFYKDDPIGSDVAFVTGGADRTSLALESVAYVRGAFAWRLSAWL